VALRVVAAGLIVALGVGVAVWLHGYEQTKHFRSAVFVGTARYHPSWADPVAAGALIAAVAIGAALLLAARKRAA
jgi:hypothetical protein